ncbi:MAG: hypothetical protein SPL30_01520 [Succinivibrio sp.]|jgi:hypothetical protein|nr:hypothetical protein [Succinivibrio sp.]
MGGMYETRDGDFASLIEKLDAESIDKFKAESKASLKEHQRHSRAQPGDYPQNASLQQAVAPGAVPRKSSRVLKVIIAFLVMLICWFVSFVLFIEDDPELFAFCLISSFIGFIAICVTDTSKSKRDPQKTASQPKS